MRGARLVTVLLLAVAVAVVLWVRLLPLDLPGVSDPAVAAALRYTGADGRAHVYLGDRDSYLWLRHARNLLRTGSACEAVVDGECRDTLTLAPLGGTARYAGSLHSAAIVAVHRAATVFVPQFPLPASAYLVTVLIGVLAVFPAFALGRQLAGPIGGLVAALMVGLHPAVLQRSLGADNDIWNVALPLATVWAVSAALAAGPRTALAYALLAGIFSSLHAAIWRGWSFAFAVILGGLAAAFTVHALRWALRQRNARVWQSPAVRQTSVVACVYLACAALATLAVGAEEPALRVIANLAGDVFASGGGGQPPAVDLWPSALNTVSELRLPTLGTIAVASYGALLFFVGWLGLLALLLPRDGWTPAHFVVWIAGNVLYRYLLTTVLDRRALLALLALPLLGAVALSVTFTKEDDERDIGPALLVLTWFLAALYFSYGGLRFILLLGAPFGV
ncbi:MAG: STT3 domain-containing protein, partial [Candidatus Binatia bacterium]